MGQVGQSSRCFQIGVLLARLEAEGLISELVDGSAQSVPAAVSLMRVSLANYFAAALWPVAGCL